MQNYLVIIVTWPVGRLRCLMQYLHVTCKTHNVYLGPYIGGEFVLKSPTTNIPLWDEEQVEYCLQLTLRQNYLLQIHKLCLILQLTSPKFLAVWHKEWRKKKGNQQQFPLALYATPFAEMEYMLKSEQLLWISLGKKYHVHLFAHTQNLLCTNYK